MFLDYKYQENELFKRMKYNSFAKLLLEYSMTTDYLLRKERQNQSGANRSHSRISESRALSSPSTNNNLNDFLHPPTVDSSSPAIPVPFLLLDARENDIFEFDHIIGGKWRCDGARN